MRRSSISLFTALSVLVLLTACTPVADNQTPKTSAESDQLTLEATGALTAPQPVSERVAAELELIRTGYPVVAGIKALPAWHLQKLLIGFDDPGWAAVQGGTYTAWDTLNNRYGVTKIDASFLAPSKVVVLTFAVPYNMPLLAPEYAKLPNVLYAEPNGTVGDGNDVCLSIDGDNLFFIFDAASGDCPAGCTQHTYWGFVVAANSEITELGTWDDSTGNAEPAWLSDPPAPACTKWLGYVQTPKTDAESEQLTLEATGALTASPPVSERVAAELELIRTMQPAVAGIKARPAWVLQEMLIAFDDTGWTAVQGGTYTAWDALNSTYGVTKIEASIPASRKSVKLTFAGRYNMPLLAPEYAELPNVRFAEQNGVIGDGPDVCMAIGNGDDHLFIFDAAAGFDCPAGCTENVYWGFVAAPDGRITELGTWDDSTVSVEPAWLSDSPAPACTKWLGYGHTFGLSGVLSGTVMFWEGDFIPGTPTGTKTPVVREVYVYEQTSFSAVTNAHEFFDGFYSDIRANLAAVVTSNTDGRFSLRLPAGRYSLFVMEDGLYYANRLESDTINPVTVTTRATTTVDFDITYQVSF